MSQGYVPLAGSERTVPAGARYLGPVNPNEWVEVSLYLRLRAPADELFRQAVRSSERVTREEYASRYGVLCENSAEVATGGQALRPGTRRPPWNGVTIPVPGQA
jgi:kumamolisin